MIQNIVNLILTVLVFAVATYGLHWICIKFALPQPVLWICGVALLIVVLLYLSGQIRLPLFR